MERTIAILVPRCTDLQPPVRRLAVEGVQMSLYINHVLRVSAEQQGYQVCWVFGFFFFTLHWPVSSSEPHPFC